MMEGATIHINSIYDVAEITYYPEFDDYMLIFRDGSLIWLEHVMNGSDFVYISDVVKKQLCDIILMEEL